MEESAIIANKLYKRARIYCHGSDSYTRSAIMDVFGEMSNTVKKNHAMAFILFSESAKLGNVEALCCIGCCYKKGYGCKCNEEYAIKWYQHAIEKGNLRAKDHLLSWAKDLYKDRYYIKAVKLFDISKAFLDDDAHFMLGFCYEEGKGGLSPNHGKAKEQYNEIKGDLLDYADYFYTGRYVGHPRLDVAFEWYKKAAIEGNVKAVFSIGYCFERGLGIPKDAELAQLFYSQISKAEDQFSIGMDLLSGYRNNHKWQKKYLEGKKWIEKAASQGYINAILILGICYMKGYGVEINQEEATFLFDRITSPKDLYDVGCYLSDFLTPELHLDDDFVLSWFLKAAEKGHAEAQYRIALLKLELDGIGIISTDIKYANITDGILWLEKSASLGHNEAQYYLGRCYAEGFGVSQDKEKAIIWLEKSVKQNNTKAQQYLKNLLNIK